MTERGETRCSGGGDAGKGGEDVTGEERWERGAGGGEGMGCSYGFSRCRIKHNNAK